jgi:Arc/MetJ family transcription regulator
MRTSIEISDALLARARKIVGRRRVTLRALVEEGLRHVLREEQQGSRFRLRDARFEGPAGFVAGRTEADVAHAIREFNEGAGLP